MLTYGSLLLAPKLTRFAERAGHRYNIGYISIAAFDNPDHPSSATDCKCINRDEWWRQGTIWINGRETYTDGQQYWIAHQTDITETQVTLKQAMEWLEKAASEPGYTDTLTVDVLNAHAKDREAVETWKKAMAAKAKLLHITVNQLLTLIEIAHGGESVVKKPVTINSAVHHFWSPLDGKFLVSTTKKSFDALVDKRILSYSDQAYTLDVGQAAELRSISAEHPMPLMYQYTAYAK